MIDKIAGGIIAVLLPEVRKIRRALQRIARGLEEQNALARPTVPVRAANEGDTEVTYVNDAVQAEWMDVEMRLTQAKGIPPSEDEILAEWERRHTGGDDAQPGA